MAGNGSRNRRTKSGEFRTKPRSSPASAVIVMVSGVLLATAAATAIFGGGYDDATPHGQLLGTLHAVAEAQEAHYRENGEFAIWRHSLDLDIPSDVELTALRANGDSWEVVVEAEAVGLTCSQAGSWSGRAPVRQQPVCYRDAP